jgi:hypothetical protein
MFFSLIDIMNLLAKICETNSVLFRSICYYLPLFTNQTTVVMFVRNIVAT